MVSVCKDFFPLPLRKTIKYLLQIEYLKVRRASFKPEIQACLLVAVHTEPPELRTVATKEVR